MNLLRQCAFLIFLLGLAGAQDCGSPGLANGYWSGSLNCGSWDGNTVSCGCTCSAFYSYGCSGGFAPANTNIGSCSGSRACIMGTCGTGSYSFSSNGAACIRCAAGTFAPAGAASCQLCTAGYFCLAGSSFATQNTCPAGYWCGLGTQSATQNPCPAGRFSLASCNLGCSLPALLSWLLLHSGQPL